MKDLTLILTGLLIVLSSCSLFNGENEQPAEIRFTMQNFDVDITINASDIKSQFHIERDDFSGTHNETSSELYRTAAKGVINISVELYNESKDLFSVGEFQLDLKENWRWEVNLRVDNEGYAPLEGCFGCLAYYSFAINKDAAGESAQLSDSLYVVIGGNYISDPVIY